MNLKKNSILSGIGLAVAITVAIPKSLAEESSANSEQKDDVKPEKKRATVSEKYRDKKKHGSFVFSPGIYRATDPHSSGYEFSFLYNGYGPVIGYEKGKFKYAEIEFASIFMSLGAGIRKVEKKKDEDTGEDATQITLALPFFPLFPYARWMFDDPERSREIGVMLKFPLSFGKAKDEEKD